MSIDQELPPEVAKNPQSTRVQARKKARLFHLFSEPYRIRIVEILVGQGPMSVARIVSQLGGAKQPNISFHLARLVDAGIVDADKEEKRQLFSLTGRGRRYAALISKFDR